MTKEELRGKYGRAWRDYVRAGGSVDALDDTLYGVYTQMWDYAPNKVTLTGYASYMKDRFQSVTKMDRCVGGEEKLDEKYDNIVIENTLKKAMKELDRRGVVYDEVRYEDYPIIITENGDFLFVYVAPVVLTREPDAPDWLTDSLVIADDDASTYNYLIYDKDGFTTMPLELNQTKVDLKLNYNDDLPDKQIRKFLNSDQPGLVILHGKPGTGKTTYIRDLICTVDREFLYMDQSGFDNITDASFIRTLDDYKNAVIILEDCESMLTERIEGNAKLASLLNLTDGLLGDTFCFKVICTFNADISKIDDALIRNGRLKVNYEFGKLSADKVQRLAKKLRKKRPNKDMYLCDVYNDADDVVTSEEKRIGFNLGE